MWNNQKQQKIVFPYVKLTNLLSFQTRFPKQKVDQHTGGKWLIHGIQTPQGQSVAKPGTPR